MILLHHLAQRLALLLYGARRQIGAPAEGCGARAALEIVRHHDAGPRRLREVHVTVDPAGQHQFARRVDDLARVAEVASERRDFFAADPEIAGEGIGRRRDRSAADDRVKCHGLAYGWLILSSSRSRVMWPISV